VIRIKNNEQKIELQRVKVQLIKAKLILDDLRCENFLCDVGPDSKCGFSRCIKASLKHLVEAGIDLI
jgi:hypothetical protein